MKKSIKQSDNFWKLRRESKRTRRKIGRIEVQSIGFSASGELICAGVHWVKSIIGRWAWRIFHNWKRWRRWYDRLPWNESQDYPAKHDASVAMFGIHPVDDPKSVIWIRV